MVLIKDDITRYMELMSVEIVYFISFLCINISQKEAFYGSWVKFIFIRLGVSDKTKAIECPEVMIIEWVVVKYFKWCFPLENKNWDSINQVGGCERLPPKRILIGEHGIKWHGQLLVNVCAYTQQSHFVGV